MSGRSRLTAVILLVLGIATAVGLLAFASGACPVELPGQPCPQAGSNRIVVVMLTGLVVALVVTPFAFLAEFAIRRRIVYRGAWQRAMRRGLLAGLAVAAIAGLRLGGALSVPAAMFVAIMIAMVEWFAVRRFDAP